MSEVFHQTLRRPDRLCPGSGLSRRDLLEDLAQRLLPSAAPLHGARQIVGWKSIQRRDREAIDMPRVGRERDGGKERDQKTDLGTLVELPTAGEVRGDLSLRKGMKEGRGVGVVPDEDREVAEAPLPPHRLARDQLGHRLRLLNAGHSLEVIDVDLVARGAAAQPLIDPEARLEALGVLGNEPVGGIEQTLR